MTKVNIEHQISQEGKTPELVIRTGEAAKPLELKSVLISGILDSPARWLEKKTKAEGFNTLGANIQVDREQMAITLVVDEEWPVNTTVIGKLEFHPVFIKFGINRGEYRSTIALAEFFKYNRTFFENHSEAMKIVTALKNFKGNVDKKVELSGDANKGDRRILIDQVVKNNLPDTFNLKIPIFKGTRPEVFQVELMFNPDDLTCSIVSPAAADLVEHFRDSAIDEQIKVLEKFDIVIIEK